MNEVPTISPTACVIEITVVGTDVIVIGHIVRWYHCLSTLAQYILYERVTASIYICAAVRLGCPTFCETSLVFVQP